MLPTEQQAHPLSHSLSKLQLEVVALILVAQLKALRSCSHAASSAKVPSPVLYLNSPLWAAIAHNARSGVSPLEGGCATATCFGAKPSRWVCTSKAEADSLSHTCDVCCRCGCKWNSATAPCRGCGRSEPTVHADALAAALGQCGRAAGVRSRRGGGRGRAGGMRSENDEKRC